MAEYSDVSFELKPETLKAIHFIYKEQCNLRSGEKVLIVADSHTPNHVISAFSGMAMAMGAESFELRVPQGPHPSYQPGYKWGAMVESAVMNADLIVDMALGYADVCVRAVQNGKRIVVPGDATGAPHIEDSLIRCTLIENPHEIRREAAQYRDIMTQGQSLHLHSEEGSDYHLDISDLVADSFDGFQWDNDTQEFVSSYAYVPGGMPGFVVPQGRGDGVLALDGLLLYSHSHVVPAEPVLLTIEKGRIRDVAGDRLTATRLIDWLKSLDDEGAYNGPIHLNLGMSRLARLTEHLEWERVRGSTVMGFGDNSLLAPFFGPGIKTSTSKVHWDTQVLRSTMDIDGKRICQNGILTEL